MRYLLFILLFATTVSAQQRITEAETSFATLAKDSGMKRAFLRYLDSTAVTFQNGMIQNGRQQVWKQPDTDVQLIWKPVYYYTALSGNTGFTTGPYELRAPGSDSAADRGQFSSIWAKDAYGNWKVVLDIGVSTPRSKVDTISNTKVAKVSSLPSGIGDIREVEARFLKSYQTAGNLAFSEYIDGATWFNLEGYPPLHDSTSIMQAISQVHGRIMFKPVAGGLSEDRDLGYVYGYTLEGSKRNNYMRVWNHTQSGWKILLQIIQW
ncbi:hypothetical protein [Chitinophaga sp. sic0106]|uniref:hypothetical protein n=1 Tax=Chitinophaga sp. sic0106 TaxID=2854785 RepID=UPI001C4904A2|nr:hypothetical protein [Chitinophaga sp. sic0106]MBV7530039.1 hypothetical protein [Chitinophaga sp. sic0106]